MKKKIIFPLAILLLLFMIVSYYRPLQVADLISYHDDVLPEIIDAQIFFSAHSQKDFAVKKENSIRELLDLLGKIRVRKTIFPPPSYRPKMKSTYNLQFTINKEKLNINILSSDYLDINGKLYQITGSPNLSGIYDIIILDQPAGALQQFYYDLIYKNE